MFSSEARRYRRRRRPIMSIARTLSCYALVLLAAACTHAPQPETAESAVTWCFDTLERIGGRPVRAEGGPRLIDTQAGRAVLFDGVDDALFLDRHPLAGASAFTFEAVFRPDGGAFEQRWFHLAEAAASPPPGASPPVDPSGTRMMFEIRVVGDLWYLDAFAAGPGYRQALMVPEKSFPIGRWYHVAQTYDGRTYRAYVDGVLQAEAEIAFAPQGQGHAAIGTRINRRDYFKGAVRIARFTPRALAPAEFAPRDSRCRER
jgi:hypothetical protein